MAGDFRTPHTNFTAGEFSPELAGRFDVKRYFNSAKAIENFLVKPFGGVYKRPGTYFVAPLLDETVRPRFIPFKFSTLQTYNLIFEPGQMWVTSGSGVIMAPEGGSVYTMDTPYTEEHLSKLTHIQDKDVLYIFCEDVPPHKIIRHDHNNWEISQVEFIGGPFGDKNQKKNHLLKFSGRTGIVDVESTDPLFSQGDPSKDELGVGDDFRILDGHLKVLTVYGAFTAQCEVLSEVTDTPTKGGYGKNLVGDWTNEEGTVVESPDNVRFRAGSLWRPVKQKIRVRYGKKFLFDFTALNLGGGAGLRVKIIARDINTADDSVMTDADYVHNIFDSTFTVGGRTYFVLDMGDYMGPTLPFHDATNSYPPDPTSAEIEIRLEPTGTEAEFNVKDMSIRQDEAAHPEATTDWARSAFSERHGYARCGAFYNGRLIMAGTKVAPNAVWFSKSDGDKEDLNAWDAEVDTSGIYIKLEGRELETIKWIEAKEDIWLGTDRAVWKVSSTDADRGLTPSTLKATSEEHFGSGEMDAIAIENVILYVSRSHENVREIAYTLEQDGWKSIELSLFAGHLLNEQRAVTWTWQQLPFPWVWIVREDGTLLSMTYLREQSVVAFARHPMENGHVEQVNSITLPDGTERIWLCVRRTINGETRRYVEYLSAEAHDIEDWHYVDSGLTYNGPPLSRLTGADHLEGETVRCLADGAVLDDAVVTDGAIDLVGDAGAVSASKVHIGLKIKSKLRTQNIEQQQQNGTIQGLEVQITKLLARLYKTGAGLYVGTAETSLTPIIMRGPDGVMDEPPPEFTGDAEIYTLDSPSPDTSVLMVHEAPTAVKILGIVAEWEGDL